MRRLSQASLLAQLEKMAALSRENLEMPVLLKRILEGTSKLIPCDSLFIYVYDSMEKMLVLKASQNPHPAQMGAVKLRLGEGVTGWVATHKKVVMIPRNASRDPRFKFISELPEDTFESFLSVPIFFRDDVVGVFNVQNKKVYEFPESTVLLLKLIGQMVGFTIAYARLQEELSRLREDLRSRKLVERAKGVLQQTLNVTEEQAYRMLQQESMKTRRSMADIAGAIILTTSFKNVTR
ncbi:MAG: GAF and ANTAR domain-containing protein [Acidobacteria bacterium]|nr:GAF and ANTAR domain-containing protein [Acidobacteriota bacterium]